MSSQGGAGGGWRPDLPSALDLLLTAPVVSVVPVAAKLLAHWLLTGLPLALIAPLLGYMLQLPVAATPAATAMRSPRESPGRKDPTPMRCQLLIGLTAAVRYLVFKMD